MELKQNYSLKSLNTFHVDASAKMFVEVFSRQDIIEALKFAHEDGIKILVLGGGSNILFTQDFEGLVIKNSIPGIEYEDRGDKVLVKSGAGVIWDNLVQWAVDREYYGIENLSLIPGTVGAAPIQNIGAYGVELKDCFYALHGVFTDTLEEKTFNSTECEYGYRDSIFKRQLKDRFIITSVDLMLQKNAEFNTAYRSLKKSLQGISKEQLSLELLRKNIIIIRRSKLPDPEVLGNAGSFFKNPLITADEYELMKKNFPAIPGNKINESEYKLYAGWLIEQSGFKGKRIGDVESYHKQSLIIVNHGNATGSTIKEFTELIANEVRNKFGIDLKSEVNII